MTPNLNILNEALKFRMSRIFVPLLSRNISTISVYGSSTKTFGLCLLVRNTSPFFWGGNHSCHQASTRDPGFLRCRTPQAKSETTSNMIRTPHEVRKNSSTVNRFATIFTGCCQDWGHDYDCMVLHMKAQP